MKVVALLFLCFVLAACNSTVETDVAQVKSDIEVAEVTPNRILTMEIDGMVCQMGCGGSIRKELKDVGGVSGVEFDFEDERETNVAKISFDKNLISVDEMIKAVSEINDGQFSVGSTNSENIHETSTSSNENDNHSEKSSVEVSSSGFQMPNLLDIFSGLLTN